MKLALYLADFLIVLVGFLHSYLGERYILIRLFRRGSVPRLLGGIEFTTRTLRFAWHLTTVCWLGFAIILLQLANQTIENRIIGLIIAIIFFIHFIVALVASRGKHLSWPIFLAISLLISYAVFL